MLNLITNAIGTTSNTNITGSYEDTTGSITSCSFVYPYQYSYPYLYYSFNDKCPKCGYCPSCGRSDTKYGHRKEDNKRRSTDN